MELDGLTVEERTQLLRELSEAIASGALKVRFREREVTYRSLAEMRQIKSDLENQITGRRRKRVIVTTFNRGL